MAPWSTLLWIWWYRKQHYYSTRIWRLCQSYIRISRWARRHLNSTLLNSTLPLSFTMLNIKSIKSHRITSKPTFFLSTQVKHFTTLEPSSMHHIVCQSQAKNWSSTAISMKDWETSHSSCERLLMRFLLQFYCYGNPSQTNK